MEKTNVKIPDPDVTVIITQDGVVINGTGNVLKGMNSKLGYGAPGYMQLGKE